MLRLLPDLAPRTDKHPREVVRKKPASPQARLSELWDLKFRRFSPIGSLPLAARGRSPIFTKRMGSRRSGDLGAQIVSGRVLGADERLVGRAVAPTE